MKLTERELRGVIYEHVVRALNEYNGSDAIEDAENSDWDEDSDEFNDILANGRASEYYGKSETLEGVMDKINQYGYELDAQKVEEAIAKCKRFYRTYEETKGNDNFEARKQINIIARILTNLFNGDVFYKYHSLKEEPTIYGIEVYDVTSNTIHTDEKFERLAEKFKDLFLEKVIN